MAEENTELRKSHHIWVNALRWIVAPILLCLLVFLFLPSPYLLCCLLSTVSLFIFFSRRLEGHFIFFPTPYPEGDWEKEEVEDIDLTAKDGTKIHGWFYRAEEPKKTLLFFHGNAGNITFRHSWCLKLMQKNFNVLAIDYRGYGKSAGKPTEAGIYEDAHAAYRYLIDERKVKSTELIVYGKSLGGGPASEIALRLPCAGLILQSTFTSIADMAAFIFPVLPLRWILRTRFDTHEKLKQIDVPVLIIHSSDDELIPAYMAESNYEACHQGKLKLFSGATHNGLISEKSSQLLELFKAFALVNN